MTAENNGTGTPEGDDPFAYLYRQEGGGRDGAAPAQQSGVPRRSYGQVRTVGERQYGNQQHPQQHQQGGGQQTAAFPQQQGGPQQGGPGAPQGRQPSAHYAAPETMPGGRAAMRQQGGPGGHGRGRGGGNRNGLLIGAVAVVAAVVIGIGAAMLFNDGEDGARAGDAGSTPAAGANGSGGDGQQQDAGKKNDTEPKDKGEKLPKEDAATLRLEGSAHLDKTIPGAKGKDGLYVTGMNQPGAAAKWRTEIPEAGTYDLYVRYTVPGKDMHLSLAVNGKPHATGLNMKNYANAAEGDWAKGWTYTYATVQVHEGGNAFAIACGAGDGCDVNLDQVWLQPAKAQG